MQFQICAGCLRAADTTFSNSVAVGFPPSASLSQNRPTDLWKTLQMIHLQHRTEPR